MITIGVIIAVIIFVSIIAPTLFPADNVERIAKQAKANQPSIDEGRGYWNPSGEQSAEVHPQVANGRDRAADNLVRSQKWEASNKAAEQARVAEMKSGWEAVYTEADKRTLYEMMHGGDVVEGEFEEVK